MLVDRVRIDDWSALSSRPLERSGEAPSLNHGSPIRPRPKSRPSVVVREGSEESGIVYPIRVVLGVALAIVILSASASPVVGRAASGPAPSSGDPPRETAIGTTVTGYAPWFYYVDGLINVANGNLYVTQEDIRVGGTTAVMPP